MIRHRCISYLFSFAFAIALLHHVIPHSHPKEKADKSKHHSHHEKSHHHHGNTKEHSHPDKSQRDLPIFGHFSNSDFVASAKYSHHEKQCFVIEFERPLTLSIPLPLLPGQPAPIPHARDLPEGFSIALPSLRAPPGFHS